MRIASLAKLTVIATPEPTEYNGKKSYKLTILQNGEAGSISCTEESFKTLGPVNNQFVEVHAALEYNSEYKSLRVTGIRFPNTDVPSDAQNKAPDKTSGPAPAPSEKSGK